MTDGGTHLVERRAAEAITPLRLFHHQVFNISAAQFGLSTLVLFAGLLYIPEFLQQVYGDSAFISGLFLVPMLVGLVAATAVLETSFRSACGRFLLSQFRHCANACGLE